MDILNKQITLKLNTYWLPLRIESPQKIFVDMAKDTVRALDIVYPYLENGELNYENPIIDCVTWEKWIELPVRDSDSSIQTRTISQNGILILKVRIPTVVVCTEYDKFPMKRLRLTSENIARRDNYTCQYTGKKLKKGEGNIDHVLPRDRGGKNTWENMVFCDKKVNSSKGNKTNEEAGLKLIRKPKSPSAISAAVSITPENIAHRDWKHFLINK